LLDPGGLIGYSAHSAQEAEGAALAGADYIFFAPVFEPISKVSEKNGASIPQGTARLWQLAATCPIPVYALGGLTPERVRTVMHPDAGAGRRPAGVAVVSALMAAGDVGGEVRRILAAMEV
jgi:thiamine monophosphate synthase